MWSGFKTALLLLLPGMLMMLGTCATVAGLDCCYASALGVPVAESASGGYSRTPAFIEAVPRGVTAGVGEVHTVYVTVLDKDKQPIPDVLVTASSDTPNRASVEPAEVRTDTNGKAVFTVKGVAYFSGSRAIITFKAGDVEETVETAQQFL